MYFESKFNLAPQLPANTVIIGFDIHPVREVKKDGVVTETVRCEPEKAHAYAVTAITANESWEWLADGRTEQDAQNIAKLLQSIYSAGVNHCEASKI